MDIVATLEFRPFSIVSLITFHFGEQIFGSGKASKQAYSVLYNCFGNEARGKKMPPKWNVIDDTMLNTAVFQTTHSAPSPAGEAVPLESAGTVPDDRPRVVVWSDSANPGNVRAGVRSSRWL